MSMSKIIKDNLFPLVTDEGDRAFLQRVMNNVYTTCAIRLPSGRVIDAPPEGKMWHILGGSFTLIDREAKE